MCFAGTDTRFGRGDKCDGIQIGDPGPERLARINADAHVAYHRHEQLVGTAAMRGMERRIIFPVLNSRWRQHLSELEAMRAAATPSWKRCARLLPRALVVRAVSPSGLTAGVLVCGW
jgi:hypothetical protein